jgi:hypothetical protein
MAATQEGTADPEPPLDRIRSHLALVANRDLYDPEHIDEVAALSARIAALLGLDDEEIADVEQVAQLRDVGKAMVPIAVLRKQGPLDDSEWALLQRYPEHGALLVAGTPGWERLAAPVRAGNERWDGAGYPDGLAGEAIPRSSRITYVAQAYLAMRTDRPYRAAVGEAEAVIEIAQGAGSQFCPRTVAALVGLLIGDRPEEAGQPVSAPAPADPEPVEAAAVPAAPPATDAAGAVRASLARPAPAGRSRLRRRMVAIAGAVAGAAVGLALALPLPEVDTKCPPAGEGRLACQIKDILVPAVTIVGVCAFVGAMLLGLVLVRLPAARRERQRRGPVPPSGPPAFASDPALSAANWGIVYDDEQSALRVVGRRRWRHHDGR